MGDAFSLPADVEVHFRLAAFQNDDEFVPRRDGVTQPQVDDLVKARLAERLKDQAELDDPGQHGQTGEVPVEIGRVLGDADLELVGPALVQREGNHRREYRVEVQ